MGFEDIPEDREVSFPCPISGCKGNVIEIHNDLGELRGWECDTCHWIHNKEDMTGEQIWVLRA